jgi:hypothetical protein
VGHDDAEGIDLLPLPVLAGRAVQQAVVKSEDIKNHKESVPAHWLYPFHLL